MNKGNIGGIICTFLAIVVFWLSFYGGHLLEIGNPNQDSWYVLPYIITCAALLVFLGILAVVLFDPDENINKPKRKRDWEK
jgi:H+/Cl- antiporter ClcA